MTDEKPPKMTLGESVDLIRRYIPVRYCQVDSRVQAQLADGAWVELEDHHLAALEIRIECWGDFTPPSTRVLARAFELVARENPWMPPRINEDEARNRVPFTLMERVSRAVHELRGRYVTTEEVLLRLGVEPRRPGAKGSTRAQREIHAAMSALGYVEVDRGSRFTRATGRRVWERPEWGNGNEPETAEPAAKPMGQLLPFPNPRREAS